MALRQNTKSVQNLTDEKNFSSFDKKKDSFDLRDF